MSPGMTKKTIQRTVIVLYFFICSNAYKYTSFTSMLSALRGGFRVVLVPQRLGPDLDLAQYVFHVEDVGENSEFLKTLKSLSVDSPYRVRTGDRYSSTVQPYLVIGNSLPIFTLTYCSLNQCHSIHSTSKRLCHLHLED